MGEISELIKPKVTIHETDKRDVQWAMHESTLAGAETIVKGTKKAGKAIKDFWTNW